MIDLASFFKEKPVPDWFKTHPIFKDSKIKEVHKIFPTIGLHNFEIDSNLELNNTSQLIKNLCYGISTHVSSAAYHFTHQVAYQQPNLSAKKRLEKYTPAVCLINQLSRQLSKPKPFVEQFATKQGLYLISDIIDSDKKTFAKANEGLFKVYNKLSEFLRKHYNYALTPLDNIPSFKEFSAHNVNGKMKVVFSSDGLEGAWDILTMSQRGISSCQGWTGAYKNCTIGSVLDPFTGIIYLTSGSQTEFGSKMVRRCIVRFVVDSLIKRPCIFLEYMYPNEHAATTKAFKDAIRSKLGDRFPIVDQRCSSNKYYVPFSETTSLLVKHSSKEFINRRGTHNQYGILPYRDTFMEYKIKEDNTLPTQFETIKHSFVDKLTDTFAEHTNISDIYISLIKDTIATEVFTIDAALCDNVSQYRRKACINYYSNKLKIGKTILDNMKKAMKENKDKYIFIPGLKTAPKASKKTAKSSATRQRALLTSRSTSAAEMLDNPAETIAATIDSQIMPVITNMFKTTWESITADKVKAAKSKKKRKIPAIR